MRVVDRAVYERLQGHLVRLYGEKELPRMLSRLELLVGRYGVGTCPDERCGDTLWDQTDAVVIAYGDMVREEGQPPLRSLLHFLETHLGEAVSAVHVLPFFPYSSDDGFSVIDYRVVDPAVGNWEDVQALGTSYREFAGGKGLNQAIAATRQGARVHLIGALGDDAAGDMLAEVAGGEGVDLTGLRRLADEPTGRALITVDERGENSIIVVPGANARLAPGFVHRIRQHRPVRVVDHPRSRGVARRHDLRLASKTQMLRQCLGHIQHR